MIELRRLRYMIVLAERLNFARAAEELCISQSALTKAIQALERDIGIRIFDRDRSGVNLTQQGQWIVEKAVAQLKSANDFAQQLSAVSRGEERQIRFGMAELPAYALLPSVLTHCLKNAPDLVHEVVVRGIDDLWLLLKTEEIEFFVSAEWQVSEPIQVRVESLGDFPINLIARSSHPLLNNKSTCGRRYPLLVSSKASTAERLPTELRQELACNIQIVEDFNTLVTLTRHTDAIWLTSALAVFKELADGSLIELPWPAGHFPRSFRMNMYSLSRRTQSRTMRQMREALLDAVRLLISAES